MNSFSLRDKSLRRIQGDPARSHVVRPLQHVVHTSEARPPALQRQDYQLTRRVRLNRPSGPFPWSPAATRQIQEGRETTALPSNLNVINVEDHIYLTVSVPLGRRRGAMDHK